MDVEPNCDVGYGGADGGGLGARVAGDLAVLVRVEVEAAAWSHAEQLRRPVKGFGRLLAAVASLLTALAFVSCAAVLALDTMARPWRAATQPLWGWRLWEHVFVTYVGSPSARFQRAISRQDVMGAETAAFELGALGLEDALAMVALYGRVDDRKFDRAAVRWLRRLLEEQPVMLSEARRASDWLEQLAGDEADLALGSLSSLLHGWQPLPSARGRT